MQFKRFDLKMFLLILESVGNARLVFNCTLVKKGTYIHKASNLVVLKIEFLLQKNAIWVGKAEKLSTSFQHILTFIRKRALHIGTNAYYNNSLLTTFLFIYVLRSVEGEVGTISVISLLGSVCEAVRFKFVRLGYRVYSMRSSLVFGSLRCLFRVWFALRTVLSIG